MEIVAGTSSPPIRPARCEEESGTLAMCICALGIRKSGQEKVECMRTGKAKWARRSKENELSENPRDTVSSL